MNDLIHFTAGIVASLSGVVALMRWRDWQRWRQIQRTSLRARRDWPLPSLWHVVRWPLACMTAAGIVAYFWGR